MDTILTSIKKLLGIEEEYTHFDPEITININTAFMELMQIGVGVDTGFRLTTGLETWEDFLADATDLEGVKTYIYYTVRLGFDPPTHGFLVEAMNRQREILAWRLQVQAENREWPEEPIV